MATVTPSVLSNGQNLYDFNGVTVHKWDSMANGDVGAPVTMGRRNDKTVQIFGTPGIGGTVIMEGSLDGVNYAPLKNVFNGDLSFTDDSIATITEVTTYIRPSVTAGDGTTSFTVLLLSR